MYAPQYLPHQVLSPSIIISEKNIINVNVYDQSGNFGAGHVSDSEIKDQAKLSGIINESGENTNTASKEIEQNSNNTSSEKAETTKFLEVTISGEFESINLADILRIQSELISKLKNTQKTSINIVDAEPGSIKLTFEGSEDELKQIQALIESGELTELSGRTIENVKLINSEFEEQELRKRVNKRNQLAQELRSQNIVERKLKLFALKFGNFREIFLRKADLRGADLRGADLSLVNLSLADLRSANLIRIRLSGADLNLADLRGAKLFHANLRSADLSLADLRGAKLFHADLRGANLKLADLRSADLSLADLRGAKLFHADLNNTNIDKKTKLDSKWRRVWEIINHGVQDQNLSRLDLSNANLRSIDLSNARLIKTNLNYSWLENTNLIGANLISADLRNAHLFNANLTDADLSGAKVKNARFGYNKGISDTIKLDLQSKGAIFVDSPPGDRSKVLTPV